MYGDGLRGVISHHHIVSSRRKYVTSNQALNCTKDENGSDKKGKVLQENEVVREPGDIASHNVTKFKGQPGENFNIAGLSWVCMERRA
jgi:hypothetical protein